MYLQVITVTRNASLLNKFQPRVHLHLPYKQPGLTVCNYLVNTLYHEIMYLQVITVTRNASLLNKFQPRVHLHLPYKQPGVVYSIF